MGTGQDGNAGIVPFERGKQGQDRFYGQREKVVFVRYEYQLLL
jgi:hypothetical protein